jgi:hypothetical protein
VSTKDATATTDPNPIQVLKRLVKLLTLMVWKKKRCAYFQVFILDNTLHLIKNV